MPKRTNEFQKLVYLVRDHLSDGAKVTESKLLRDKRTKTLREVDVCIEGKVASLPVVVSVECRDHKRVADVTWVDAMRAKHERLPTNVLMLASRSGFTPEALRVAKEYGIQTFALESVDTADFPRLLEAKSTLWSKSASFTATKVVARVPATTDLKEERVVLMPDNLFYRADGQQLCMAHELVDVMMRAPKVGELLKDAAAEHKFFVCRWNPPDDLSGNPIYLEKTEPKMLRKVELLEVTGECRFAITPFGVRRGRLGEVQVAWGVVPIEGREAMLVATRNASGIEKLTVHTYGQKPGTGGAP